MYVCLLDIAHIKIILFCKNKTGRFIYFFFQQKKTNPHAPESDNER